MLPNKSPHSSVSPGLCSSLVVSSPDISPQSPPPHPHQMKGLAAQFSKFFVCLYFFPHLPPFFLLRSILPPLLPPCYLSCSPPFSRPPLSFPPFSPPPLFAAPPPLGYSSAWGCSCISVPGSRHLISSPYPHLLAGNLWDLLSPPSSPGLVTRSPVEAIL